MPLRLNELMYAPAIFLLTALLLVAGCGKTSDVNALLAEAKQARSKGDYKTAIIQLKNALQASPDNDEARYQLGLVYNDSGDPRSAEKEFRKALELKKDPALVIPNLAKALLSQGEFQKVLMDTEPDGDSAMAPELHSVRGMAQLSLGKFGDAKASFDWALAQSPMLPDALIGRARLAVQDKDIDAAIRLTDQVLDKSPRHLDALLLKGDLLRLKNDGEAAIATYQKVVHTYQDSLAARINMASIYIGAGKYDEAAKQVEAVRKVSPQSVMANYLQALSEFKQQHYAQAKEAVQQVLKIAPTHLPSQMLAGAVEFALGNNAQAEQYLKFVLEKTPNNLYARKLLIVALLRDHQIARAVEILQPAVRQGPEDPSVLALAGEVYMQNKEFAKATKFYEKAATIDPRNAQMRTGLGVSRLASGEADRAMADLEVATDLDANRYQADVLLIMTHLTRKEYDQAERAIQALKKKQPNNPLTYNLEGAALIGKKKFAEARKSFERALQLESAYFPAVMNLAQLDLQEKNPQTARKRFESILEKDPKNQQTLIALAGFGSRISASSGEALEWLERARKGNPTSLQPPLLLSRYYLGSGDTKKAVELALEAHNMEPENPEALDALGLAQLTAGEKNAAVTTFSKLVSAQPGILQPLIRLADAQFANGNTAGATTSLKKALQIKPDLLEAQTALIGIETRAGHNAEALQIVKNVQSQSPKAAVGNVLEGDVRFAEKQYAQAAISYQKAYAVSPSGPVAVKWHAALAQSGKPDDGNAKLRGWLKDNPDDIAVRLYLADAYLKQRKHSGAIEQYEWIAKKQPQNLLVLNNLAWTYQQVKDPRALQVAQQAYKAAPNNAQVLDTYGWMLVEQGQPDNGADVLERAVSVASDQQEIRFHYASALYRSGKKERSRIELERLFSSGVKFAQETEAAALLAQIEK